MADDGSSAGKAKFAGREIDNVHLVGQQMVDFLGGHILALCLASFHEVDVVLQQRSVQYAGNTEFVTDVCHGQHVLQADGLSTDEVSSGFHAHIGNLLRSIFADGLLQFLQVKVALEGVVALGQQTFLLYQFKHLASATGNVCLCGGEVEVHDGHHSGLHKAFGQNVLAGASLVGGQHVVHAEDLLHGSLQTVESLASGIRVVGGVHGSGLAV